MNLVKLGRGSYFVARSVYLGIPLAILALSLTSLGQQSQQAPQQAPRSHVRRRITKTPTPEQQQAPRSEIIRENNYGVALMNRQHFEEALGKFQRACILDQVVIRTARAEEGTR